MASGGLDGHFQLLLRVVQLVFSVVVLGLSGYVVNWYNVDTLTSSSSQANFLIFAALWSLISVAYLELTPRFAPRASHPYVAIGIEFTNVLFWFAGFVALAVFLSRLFFCRGSVCRAAQAANVFAAMLFVLWTFTTTLLAKDLFKSGFRKPSRAGTSHAGPAAAFSGPIMETAA